MTPKKRQPRTLSSKQLRERIEEFQQSHTLIAVEEKKLEKMRAPGKKVNEKELRTQEDTVKLVSAQIQVSTSAIFDELLSEFRFLIFAVCGRQHRKRWFLSITEIKNDISTVFFDLLLNYRTYKTWDFRRYIGSALFWYVDNYYEKLYLNKKRCLSFSENADQKGYQYLGPIKKLTLEERQAELNKTEDEKAEESSHENWNGDYACPIKKSVPFTKELEHLFFRENIEKIILTKFSENDFSLFCDYYLLGFTEKEISEKHNVSSFKVCTTLKNMRTFLQEKKELFSDFASN